jgi:hypothetical protein
VAAVMPAPFEPGTPGARARPARAGVSHSLEASGNSNHVMAGFMIEVLILGVMAAFLLYAVDRLVKARARARRLRAMSERLAVAAARAEEQHEERQAVVAASAALTSVVPAIKHPALSSGAGGQEPGTPGGDG